MSKSRVYKFDKNGNLISMKQVREPEVKIWREDKATLYSVSRDGKILHAGIIGDLDDCARCHGKIRGKPMRIGNLKFHYECFLYDEFVQPF